MAVVVQIIESFENILEDSGNGGLVQNPRFTIGGLHFVLDYVQQASHLNKLAKTENTQLLVTSSSLSTSQSSSLTTKLV